MKKIMFLGLFLVLFGAVGSFADQTANQRTPREWDLSTASKSLESKDYTADASNATNLVVNGHQIAGNPGFYALTSTGDNTSTATTKAYTYYLWVDVSSGTGKLMIASYLNLRNYSSFPYGSWRATDGFGGGTIVGSQS